MRQPRYTLHLAYLSLLHLRLFYIRAHTGWAVDSTFRIDYNKLSYH